MGRRPIPTVVKEKRGNPGKRPLLHLEPIPDPSSWECPDWFGDVAREEWFRVYEHCEKIGMISLLDEAILIAYCVTWERFFDAQAMVTDIGPYVTNERTGVCKTAPWVQERNNAVRDLKGLVAELGFSPASRAKVSRVPPGKRTGNSSDDEGGWPN